MPRAAAEKLKLFFSGRRGAAAALLAALALALVYFQTRDYYPTGWLNDDARHLLAGRAVASGSFSWPHAPGNPPITNLLPGYPLIIAPLAGSPEAVKALSAAFSAGAVVLCGLLVGGPAGLAAAALLAVSHLLLGFSATAMSEPAFLFWTLGCLLLHRRFPGERDWLVLPASALACWIRPHGALLFFLLAADRASRRGLRPLSGPLIFSALLLAAPFLRNLLVAGTPASYFTEAPGGGAAELAARLLENLLRYGAELPRAALGFGGAAAAVIFWGALAAGCLRLRGEGAVLRRNYLLATLLLHLFWVNSDPRYMLPVLPVVFEALLAAFRAPPGAGWPRLLPAAALGAAVAAGNLAADLGIFRASAAARGAAASPPEAAGLLRRLVPPGGVVMATFPESAALSTGLKTAGFSADPDPDRWYRGLLDAGVTHAWRDSSRGLIHSVAAKRDPLQRTLRGVDARLAPPRFRRVYLSADGRNEVLALTPAPGFREHYAGYETAGRLIEDGRLEEAFAVLEKLLKERADLVRLPFRAGTTALLLGRPDRAVPLLEKAAAAEPGFGRAAANLAAARAAAAGKKR